MVITKCPFCDSTDYRIEIEWLAYKNSIDKSPMIYVVCNSCNEDTANYYCLTYNAQHRMCLIEFTRKVNDNKKGKNTMA